MGHQSAWDGPGSIDEPTYCHIASLIGQTHKTPLIFDTAPTPGEPGWSTLSRKDG